MLRVAVCDDDPSCLEAVRALLHSYGESRGLKTEAAFFERPEKLTAALEEGKQFQMYLLDVYLPGMNGIQLAQALRRRDADAPLIFLTTSTEYALEAFGVGATQYLVKPLAQTAFFAAMGAAAKRLAPGRKALIFKSGGAYQTVAPEDLLYSEAQGNYQCLHLQGGEMLSVRITAGELYSQLAPVGCFIRCGASFILNLAHAKRLNPKAILMSDHTEIPIPRGAYPEIKGSYFAFFSERE